MYDDFDEIRKQAEERVKKRELAKESLEAFLLIAGFLWLVWLIAMIAGVRSEIVNTTFWILLPISGIWGFIAIGTWYNDVYAAEKREENFKKQVEQEIEREMEKRNLTEKRKRLGLSDDGELVELIEDDYLPEKRQSDNF